MAYNMFYLLLLASVSVAFAANAKTEAQPELKPAETATPIRVHDDERRYRFEDGLELIRSRDARQRIRIDGYREDRQGHQRIDIRDGDIPVILRTPDPFSSQAHPDIERQNRIIADVYSPDYYQPTWILDYRYLKTGGRDYTRSPGGHILILPKNVRINEHKDFPDFDSFLEHLRLSRLSERSSKYSGHGDHHDARRPYQTIGLGQYGRGPQLQQNWWKANRNH